MFQLGHDCGDAVDLINGRPTGSVRISFGLSSTMADVNKFLHFIKSCFVEAFDHINLPVFGDRGQLVQVLPAQVFLAGGTGGEICVSLWSAVG